MPWYTITRNGRETYWLEHEAYEKAEATARENAAHSLACKLAETVKVSAASSSPHPTVESQTQPHCFQSGIKREQAVFRNALIYDAMDIDPV